MFLSPLGMNPTLDMMLSVMFVDRLAPQATSNKPLTPFRIVDILNKPPVARSSHRNRRAPAHLSCSSPAGHAPTGMELLRRAPGNPTSPLSALQDLASKTFKGLDVGVLQAAEGRDGITLFGSRTTPKKRRKSRTAFTNHQIYELEKRFLYQKYLSPADRDQIAAQLGLSSAQVITWFQNRRAKLKRDLDEMKADVESARSVGTVVLDKLSAGEREAEAEAEACVTVLRGPTAPGAPSLLLRRGREIAHKLRMSPSAASLSDHTSPHCSEDEDVEIDVDD